MFCAAIPAAAAVGAKLNAKQQAEARDEAEAGAENMPAKPIKTITGGVIVLLLVGSVIYHTRFNSLF
jgi:hypothetical protein